MEIRLLVETQRVLHFGNFLTAAYFPPLRERRQYPTAVVVDGGRYVCNIRGVDVGRGDER